MLASALCTQEPHASSGRPGLPQGPPTAPTVALVVCCPTYGVLLPSPPPWGGAGWVAHLAHEVGEVEHCHGEDGQPLAQDAVPDLRLEAREQAQRDEVGHSDGQHVGPDDAGHRVAVPQQGCGAGWGSGAGPRPPSTASLRMPHTCRQEGWGGGAGGAGGPPALSLGPGPHLGRTTSSTGLWAEVHRTARRLPCC